MLKEFENLYFITGVNGVGKTTLSRHIVDSDSGTFDLFPGSACFMEWLGLAPGNYEALRKLPEQDKIVAFSELMEEVLAQKAKEGRGILLVDAHLFNYKRGEMVDRTGGWMRYFDAIFMVTVDPDALLERINEDRKNRNLFPEVSNEGEKRQILKDYLEKTRAKAQEISERLGIPFFEIPNPEGGLGQAVAKFFEYHSELNADGVKER